MGDRDRLTADLTAGGESRKLAIASLRGNVQRLSFEPVGCRVVQLAIQVGGKDTAADLVAELHGCVQRATQSPYGNYVIQKIIETLPVAIARFVAEELRGVAGLMARHRYGCRILCRLLEHSASDVGASALVDEMVVEASELSRHTFAHHVMQAILEHGLPQHRRHVIDALARSFLTNSQDRNASYVIETALTHCEAQDQQGWATEVLSADSARLVSLARSHTGIRVLKELIKSQGEHAHKLLDRLQRAVPDLHKTRHGHRFLQDLKVPLRCVSAT